MCGHIFYVIDRFYIDEVPIREVVRSEAMGGDYPSKPMALYATIWDGSTWATSGGRYKVNYKYSPFVSEFKGLALHGCAVDPIEMRPSLDGCAKDDAKLATADYAVITPERRSYMRKFREMYMTYSYCYDAVRYPVVPPECVVLPSEKRRFNDAGRLKFGSVKRSKKRSRMWAAANKLGSKSSM